MKTDHRHSSVTRVRTKLPLRICSHPLPSWQPEKVQQWRQTLQASWCGESLQTPDVGGQVQTHYVPSSQAWNIIGNEQEWSKLTQKSQTVARPCANCVQLKSIDINWTYCWVLPRLILFMRPICLQAVLYTGCDSRTSQDIQFGMFVVEQVQRIDVKWGKFSFLLLHLFFSHLYSNRWSSQVLKATI